MNPPILCIGAALLDEVYFSQLTMLLETSNPAHGTTSVGGVMTNVARHLAALEIPIQLITALGTDAAGQEIHSQLEATGIDLTHVLSSDKPTGKYIAFHHPNGQLFTAICQDEITALITPDFLETKMDILHQAFCIVADTNLAVETLQWLSTQAALYHWQLVIEPVSVLKAVKLKEVNLNPVVLLTPNEEELEALGGLDSLFQRGVKAVWLRKGSAGSSLYTTSEQVDLGVPTIQMADSTGAGDAALAGWLYAQYHHKNSQECLEYGHALALHILHQKGAVDSQLHPQQLELLKENYYP
ncbi:PfkB family carbohydrate kinase [Flavobacterium stagni]|uniref:Carbohydrate kinase PfkB domain-containing protein n=1 Tax=Flavobacterium stagni TaxID=2506421 RepID=A0A4Q1K360_9FLAO|nr:PfkB family carbohydrate kinase [Flavobacterium stagni]RXR20213.1 hypothetical protein EQG61_13260 [Flavobacterium stagni]